MKSVENKIKLIYKEIHLNFDHKQDLEAFRVAYSVNPQCNKAGCQSCKAVYLNKKSKKNIGEKQC